MTEGRWYRCGICRKMFQGMGIWKSHFDRHPESRILREIDWWTPTLTTSTPTDLDPNLKLWNIEEEGEKIE